MSGFAPLPNFQPPFLAGYIPAPRRSMGEEVLGSALGAAATKGVGSLMDKYLVSEEDKLRQEFIQEQIKSEQLNRQIAQGDAVTRQGAAFRNTFGSNPENDLARARARQINTETDAFVSNNEQTAVNALIDRFTGSGIPQEVFSGATTIEEVNQAAKQHGNNIAQDLSTEDSGGGGWSQLGKSGGTGVAKVAGRAKDAVAGTAGKVNNWWKEYTGQSGDEQGINAEHTAELRARQDYASSAVEPFRVDGVNSSPTEPATSATLLMDGLTPEQRNQLLDYIERFGR